MAKGNGKVHKKRKGTGFDIKTKIFTVFSIILSSAFATGNLIVAVLYRSVWFMALFGYYAIISVFRVAVLISNVVGAFKFKGDSGKYKWKIYLGGGLLMLITALAMGAAVGHLAIIGKPSTNVIMTFGTGAYTVYKIISAIYNAIKAGRFADPVAQTLRNINVADAGMSVVSLAAVLCATFGDGGTLTRVNIAVLGGLVCAGVVAISVIMIVRAAAAIKRGGDKQDDTQNAT